MSLLNGLFNRRRGCGLCRGFGGIFNGLFGGSCGGLFGGGLFGGGPFGGLFGRGIDLTLILIIIVLFEVFGTGFFDLSQFDDTGILILLILVFLEVFGAGVFSLF